jgi:four helix bundle protein
MGFAADQLRQRTKDYAVRIVRLVRALKRSDEGQIIGRQLLRSGTSVGANYRAACRARSKAEFAAKMGIVLEETDESPFWLELILETGLMKPHRLASLLAETNELIAIFASSLKTVKCAS